MLYYENRGLLVPELMSIVGVHCCNIDLMPFSGIVGGNTIIFLAPVS